MLDYNKLNKRDQQRISEENLMNRKDMEERKKDPYRGKIIKAGTYVYNQGVKKSSYEEKVNQLLGELNQASQNSVDNLVDQEKINDAVKQICPNPQNNADTFVTQQENLNRANEIVSQSSSHAIARDILAGRDDER